MDPSETYLVSQTVAMKMTSAGSAVACRSGTGSPSVGSATLTGAPVLSTNVSPYNDSVTSIFNVSQNELVSLAKLSVPDVPSLPPTLPAMSLIVIQGNATFTTAQPLVGSGILAVFGNLTVPAGSYFNGVIYASGNYAQSGPSLISGAVVAHGSIALSGGSDITEVDWDGSIVQQVRNTLGSYQFSRTEYVVP